MNDSIDMVVEEWALQSGRFVLHFEGECSFVKYTARDFLVVAAWRRDGPEAVLLGYLGYLTPESDHGFQWREAEVSELRAALGLPAWVAPPAPTHGAAGPWTAVEALRLLERAEAAEAALDHSRSNAARFEGSCRLLRERAELASERADRAEADTQALVAAHKEQVEQAASLKWERDEARLRVGELEREAGRREMELEQVRGWSRSSAHALNAARVLVAEALRMMDAREELDEAKGRFARAHAAYREAEEGCDDEQP